MVLYEVTSVVIIVLFNRVLLLLYYKAHINAAGHYTRNYIGAFKITKKSKVGCFQKSDLDTDRSLPQQFRCPYKRMIFSNYC